MKQLMLVTALSLFSICSFSQVASDNKEVSSAPSTPSSAAATNVAPKIVYAKTALQTAELNNEKNKIGFQNIDQLYHLRAYITNMDGDVIVNQQVSAKSRIDISRLKKGLYFVTLVNEFDNDRKSFTLNK